MSYIFEFESYDDLHVCKECVGKSRFSSVEMMLISSFSLMHLLIRDYDLLWICYRPVMIQVFGIL